MLVLRRKAGEAIVLNGTITIHVLAVEGERVKLGISAPPEVVIVRSELLENQGQGQIPGSQPGGQGPRENPNPRPPYREGDSNNGRPSGDEGPNGYVPNAYNNGNGRYAPRRRNSYGEGVSPSPVPGSTRYR